jgi:Raf kinase inhibitor-like YbhB/YbcL family protein
MSTRPTLTTDAHAAPMQMAFYTGAMFPASEQGNAFAAFRGSWNRAEPVGYDIRRTRFDANGNPVAIEPFVTGLLRRSTDGWVRHGRPAGLAFANDGALLFSDDENGVVYRVAYEGRQPGATPLAATMVKPDPVEPRPAGSALALARPEATTAGRVTVSSVSFRRNAAIPQTFSAYYEDVSPALSWTAIPAAKSYAILMEDPDAQTGNPFVHWVAWNIPATVTTVDIGVPTMPQLPELGMMRQGRNTRGSVGYFGPRPPVGDRAHRYHFQVFALDAMLDVAPGSNRETLLAAMKGRVIGKGEIVGLYGQLKPPEK